MIEKRLILILTIITILLCIGTVNATEVTMIVDSKHIVGMGNGYAPFDDSNYINPMYVISERDMGSSAHYIIQEYPISMEDYVNIQVGQTVTLEIPDSRTKPCKVIEII